MTSGDTEELAFFRDTLARLVAPWRGRDMADPAQQTALWRELLALGVAELGAAENEVPFLVVAMAETGGAACPVPIIGAATARLLLTGSDDAGALLDAIVSGSARIALVDARGQDAPGDRLTGSFAGVEDTGVATHFLLLAVDAIHLVRRDAAGLDIVPTKGFAAPPLAVLNLDGVETTAWPAAPDQIERAFDLARILLIARAEGALRRSLALAIDYATTREQFGQAIAKFQAVQHILADCRVHADLAEVLLADACDAFVHGGDTARSVASLVAAAAPALRRAAVEVVHVFGAVGYAAEHEAARHFSRIHADTTALGGVRRARNLLAMRLKAAKDRDAVMPPRREPEPVQRLRDQARQWMKAHWGEAQRSDPARNHDVDFTFLSALREAGWTSASWPADHGGPGLDIFEQFALLEELRGGAAPMTLNSPTSWIVAPAIISFGSDAMKAALLPAIAAGEMSFALGYSEPQSGSDLASLATRAERDGDAYIVNGQKIWTSLTEYATHVFLAVRSDKSGRKHEGITILIVPLDAPGLTVRRMETLHGKTFANLFFDDVQVPLGMRVGEEGQGWQIATSALGAERVLMGGQVASLRGLFADIVISTRTAGDNDAVVWDRLALLSAELDGARALSRRALEQVGRGAPAVIEGAIAKLYSGDLAERIGEAFLDLFGLSATLCAGAPGAMLNGAVSHHVRTALMLVIGGGTAQIQRNVIAQRGMGLGR